MTLLISYLIGINILTFIVRGVDKRKAVKKGRRISESQLLWLVGAGGVVGALAGQSLFRHKTIKGSFLRKFRLSVGVWIVVLVLVLLYQ